MRHKPEIDEFIKENQGKHFCHCGCGEEIEIRRSHYTTGIPKYVQGHPGKKKRALLVTKWIEENQGKHFCHCGCGGIIIILRVHYRDGIPWYITRHHPGKPDPEIDEWITENQGKHFCECGCNEEIEIKRHHYWVGIPKYVHGHNGRGGKLQSLSLERCVAISKTLTGHHLSDAAKLAITKNHEDNPEKWDKIYDRMRGGNDIVKHHFIYDHNHPENHIVKITRSQHMSHHQWMKRNGLEVPHLNVTEENKDIFKNRRKHNHE